MPLGVRILDVGTDHGYIAIALALRGERVAASDIAAAPLEKARQNAARYSADGLIDFHLCDGIPDALRGKLDCVVIAGMGGETIIGILERAPWLRESVTTLVLQPQSKQPLLREWLIADGWTIPSDVTAQDGKRRNDVWAVTRS